MNKAYYQRLASYGFWLVILGLVAYLIVPATRSRPDAERMQCLSNMHNIAIAIHNYAATSGVLPPQKSGEAELSWRISLLPVIEGNWLYRQYHRDRPWNDPTNLEFARTKIPWYGCPNNPDLQDIEGRYYTAYALLTGPGSVYDGLTPRRLDDLPAGVSQTILLVEACGANIVWNEPRDIDVARDQSGIDLNLKEVGKGWAKNYHGGYINVVLADGSARSLSIDMDHDLLKKLLGADLNDAPKKLEP